MVVSLNYDVKYIYCSIRVMSCSALYVQIETIERDH